MHWIKLFACGLILLASSGMAHADLYRCNINGQMLFQDQPCPAGSAQSKDSGSPPNTAATSAGPKAPELIDFTGDPENQLSQAAARIAVIKIKANDCDWGLKVKKNLLDCFPFLGEMVTGGPFAQSVTKITDLLKEEPQLAEGGHTASIVNHALRDGQSIRDTKNLVDAWAHSQ